MLHYAIGAGFPTATTPIALEDQRRFRVIEVFGQASLTIIPAAERVAGAKTRLSGTVLGTAAILYERN